MHGQILFVREREASLTPLYDCDSVFDVQQDKQSGESSLVLADFITPFSNFHAYYISVLNVLTKQLWP